MKKPKKQKKEKVKKEGADTAPKSGMIGKVILVAAMGATSFATVYFLPRAEVAAPVDAHAKVSEHAAEPDAKHAPEPTAMAYVDMEPFTVSLKGRTRILRIGVSLEAPEHSIDALDPNDPKLRDAFMGYLSAIDIKQVEEATFLVRLRAQLTRRAQFVLGAENIHNVMITDFLVR